MSAGARRHLGVSWVLAAALGAPLAALLVCLALPAVIPASSDVRYLVACIVVIPLMAAAPCAALLARSAARAWTGVGVTSAAALLVLWRALT
ncbi:hypothetical protein [Myxococcus eversor]|uniref:hypothetical protein n=1 Tax=Myxococcus eversor TaxID=2709661 RepID=UPI001F07A618|nr:hypothetical protein [Myxococcus eversor]